MGVRFRADFGHKGFYPQITQIAQIIFYKINRINRILFCHRVHPPQADPLRRTFGFGPEVLSLAQRIIILPRIFTSGLSVSRMGTNNIFTELAGLTGFYFGHRLRQAQSSEDTESTPQVRRDGENFGF